ASNPIIVQFKRRPHSAHLAPDNTFNPIIVQFKLEPTEPPSQGCPNFQSYNSTIQTPPATSLFMLNLRGYIKEKLVNHGCCFLFINADYNISYI
ncbi:MAG TPA: hypothetical protein VFG90_00300, partial [Nitrososphaeraceae archaeon]|nr:hypothetical protein [Nitrososphaeraceae archaeon]